MSSLSQIQLNRKIVENQELFDAMMLDDFEAELKNFGINWKERSYNKDSKLRVLFETVGFIDNDELTNSGLLFCGRLSVDFENCIKSLNNEVDKYLIQSTIRIGKNSVTYRAKHKILGNNVVLKFVRPGASENVIEALQLISSAGLISNLVQPIDFIRVPIEDIFGNSLEVDCIVFPYVNGISLKKFLGGVNKPLSAYTIASFIKQVGGVLAALERLHAYHGDLHEENIIVTNLNGTLSFSVIDVSFGITGSLSSEACVDNDLRLFRQHVWNFLSAQQQFLSKMSIRKYLGAKIFNLMTRVMLTQQISFESIISLFREDKAYLEYLREKKEFLESKFRPPGSFKLQRYEEITDQTVALKLFVPFPELTDNIKTFANTFISGNRGSGKSTYLAAIAFFPRVENPLANFHELFGVYFPCRQGEFRLLSPRMIDYENLGFERVKYVLSIKIIRRTLEALIEGIDSKKILPPSDYSRLKAFLSRFLEDDLILSMDPEVASELENLLSVMVRIELKELDNLYKNDLPQNHRPILSENLVLEFFEIIQETFSELSSTKFHLLFDDAGSPNVPKQAQWLINDLIVHSNSVFCIKLSAEKYSYDFQTTTKKPLENGQDYYEYDLTKTFYRGSTTYGLNTQVSETYFRSIITKRLEHFEYQSEEITDYLGDDIAKYESLINSLATGRKNAFYGGWSMVWRIASENPRNLLELVSEIFSVGNVDSKSIPKQISLRSQDRAIRGVSEKRLRSLAQISGTIGEGEKQFSIGRRLFDITTSVGSVYRIYLRDERGKERKRQHLAIERNENELLDEIANEVLINLIKYAVFDESRMGFSRDDQVKKPIYILNKIYCPAFNISFRRDEHLKLSKLKFEQMLLSPKKFVFDGTKRLRTRTEDSIQKDLFNDNLENE